MDNVPKDGSDIKLFLRGAAVMAVSFLFITVGVKALMVMVASQTPRLEKMGLRVTPNLRGGDLLASFEDPEGDLMVTEARQDAATSAGVDLIGFEVREVRFSKYSGMGIEPRINFVVRMAGAINRDEGRPIIEIAIDASAARGRGPNIAAGPEQFRAGPSDFTITADLARNEAVLTDESGKEIARSYPYFFKTETKFSKEERGLVITSTSLVVAFPEETIGDPRKGQWNFHVVALAGKKGGTRDELDAAMGHEKTFEAAGGADEK